MSPSPPSPPLPTLAHPTRYVLIELHCHCGQVYVLDSDNPGGITCLCDPTNIPLPGSRYVSPSPVCNLAVHLRQDEDDFLAVRHGHKKMRFTETSTVSLEFNCWHSEPDNDTLMDSAHVHVVSATYAKSGEDTLMIGPQHVERRCMVSPFACHVMSPLTLDWELTTQTEVDAKLASIKVAFEKLAIRTQENKKVSTH